MSHTISITDLANQEIVHQVLQDIQDHGTCYSLMQDGVEVAKVVPARVKKELVSDELTKKRLATLEELEPLSKKITQLWSTNETAVEAVINYRR